MERNKTIIVMLLILIMFGTSLVQADSPSDASKLIVIPNTFLALPEKCDVNVRWVSPPLDSTLVKKTYWYSLGFTVDSEGNPWIGYNSNSIISPVKQYQFKLPLLYNSFSCTGNGAFLVTTESDLCFIVPPKDLSLTSANVPDAVYQPIANLPSPGCRVFAGADKSIFLVARREDGGSDIFQYIPGRSVIRGYEKVFTSDDKVTAVSGDIGNVFVAIKGAILKVSIPDNSITKLYADPKESVRCLAYYPGVGLFYSTESTVGYIGAKGCMPFMTAPDILISLQKGTLYVLLEKSLGIIALDNIGNFRKFDRDIKEVPFSDIKNIKIASIRFFEAGEDVPKYSDRKYSTKFDHSATRYVYCQLDIKNLQYKKKEHKQSFTMVLYRSGSDKPLSTRTINLDFKPDKPDMHSGAGFGSINPGALYPGSYIVQIYLNGALIGNRRFAVTGKPNLAEAAVNNDISTVTRLIKSGADLNVTWKYGYTPLMLAVIKENVDTVKLLLDAGADVNAKSKSGDTALTIDGKNNGDDPSITKLLLKHKADINACGEYGKTALHNAAYNRRLSVVKLLLESGAKTEIKDNDGLTVLAASDIWKSLDNALTAKLIELLLEHGADTEAKDATGRTAIFQAIDARNIDAVAALVKHGANVNASSKQHDNIQRSVLGYLLDKYKTVLNYRENRNKLRKIAMILQENGADLDASEFAKVYFEGIDEILDTQHMSHLLEMSEYAAVNYETNNTYLRKACIRGLLNAAQRQISDTNNSHDYNIVFLCTKAIDRACKWGIYCSEMYFDIGSIFTQAGDYATARTYLKEYLDIAPNGSSAAKAKEILNLLK